MGTRMVTQVRELRRRAALYRRVAGIPTSGSANTDRILIVLAERLERDAALGDVNCERTASSKPDRP
jgi:hypothetical protein